MDKLIYNLINRGINEMLDHVGGCEIEDVSLIEDNKILITDEDGKNYELTITERID